MSSEEYPDDPQAMEPPDNYFPCSPPRVTSESDKGNEQELQIVFEGAADQVNTADDARRPVKRHTQDIPNATRNAQKIPKQRSMLDFAGFKTSSERASHSQESMSAIERKKGVFCQECGGKFAHNGALWMHIDRKHPNSKNKVTAEGTSVPTFAKKKESLTTATSIIEHLIDRVLNQSKDKNNSELQVPGEEEDISVVSSKRSRRSYTP